MKKLCYLSLFILYSVCSFAQQQAIPVPKPHQLKWHEAEMELSSIMTCTCLTASATDKATTVINPIRRYNIFNPTELNN